MSTISRFFGAHALLAFALFTACGRTEICDDTTTGPPGTYAPGDELVSQVNGLRGLWTSPDDLEAPDGALTEAINTALYRPGIMEPRRGEAWLTYTSIGGTIDALTEFQGYPVAHYGSTIKYFNGTSWVAYSGSFSPRSGKPACFFTQSGSLFFLSSAGVYELDAIGNAWRLTGAPAALQGSAALRRTTSETGFASANGQWAYRYVWGYTNANNKVQLGAPSGRFILTSPANVVVTTGNASKTSGTAVVTVVNTTHGFATGEYVDVTLGGVEAHFTAGRFSVTRVSATSFTYNDGGDSTYSGNPSNSITYGFTSRNATLTVPIPAQITTSYFLQVYRSAKSADANAEPSDALAQVYEKSPTNLEIAAGTMTVPDLAPDEVRQPVLYTSLGEAPHNQPPACADVAVFREGTLYGCTAQLQIMELNLLSVGGSFGIQSGDVVYFTDSPSDINTNTWDVEFGAASSENLAAGTFKLYTDGSVSQNIADTAKSLVRAINGKTANTYIYAEYASGDTDAPGRIRVYGRTLATGAFTAVAFPQTSVLYGATWAPALPNGVHITDIARSGTTVTVNTAVNHGLASGQLVYLFDSQNTSHFTNGTKTVTVVDPNTFTYTEAGSAVVAEANGGVFLDLLPSLSTSNNTDVATSVMWAPPDEPWNVPAVNFKVISPSGTLDSLVSTRDRVLIYTTKGLYSGTGDGLNWAFPEFDVTLNSKAPRTAISANGKAYGWFESGFAEMVESARIVSYPIDKTLRDLLANAGSTVATVAFAVAYESYRMVLLFVPNASGDTAAKSVYVLHTDTGDWTGPWPLDGFQSAGPVAGAAMVSPTDGKLYLASGGYVAKELKALTAADQVEALVPGVLADVINGAPVGNVITLTGTTITGLGSGILGATLLDSTTGASSTITALNAATKAVTLTSATGFASTNAVTLVSGPMTSTIRPLAMTEGDAGAQKLFREGSLAFRNSQFTSGSLTFSTDLSPTFSAATTLTPPGGASANPTEIDFWVPQSWQRATRLSMRFSHTGLAETYGLQGWTLRSRICSRRTTR
jgi:hypothetical protein